MCSYMQICWLSGEKQRGILSRNVKVKDGKGIKCVPHLRAEA